MASSNEMSSTNTVVYHSEDEIKSQLKKYKYEIVIKAVIPDQDLPIILSRNIRTVFMHYLYEDNKFPYIEAHFMLDYRTIKNLQANANSLKFWFTMRRYMKVDAEMQEDVMWDMIHDNLPMKAVDFDRNPPNATEVADPNAKPDDTEGTMGNNEDNNEFWVVLMADYHLEIPKQIVNIVAQDTTMLNSIATIMGSFSPPNGKTLVSIPDNKEVYKQLLVTPQNPIKAVKYLSDKYGIYTTGVRMFFDYKDYFLLAKDHAKRINDVLEPGRYLKVSIDICDPKDMNLLDGCATDDKNKRYVIKMVDNTKVTSKESSSRELNGEKVTFIGRNSTSHETASSTDIRYGGTNEDEYAVSNGKNSKEKVMYKNSSSKFFEEEFKFNSAFNMTGLTFILNDPDLEFLTFEKSYEINFSNLDKSKKYSGTYEVIASQFSFSKTGSTSLMSCIALMSFAKMPKSLDVTEDKNSTKKTKNPDAKKEVTKVKDEVSTDVLSGNTKKYTPMEAAKNTIGSEKAGILSKLDKIKKSINSSIKSAGLSGNIDSLLKKNSISGLNLKSIDIPAITKLLKAQNTKATNLSSLAAGSGSNSMGMDKYVSEITKSISTLTKGGKINVSSLDKYLKEAKITNPLDSSGKVNYSSIQKTLSSTMTKDEKINFGGKNVDLKDLVNEAVKVLNSSSKGSNIKVPDNLDYSKQAQKLLKSFSSDKFKINM